MFAAKAETDQSYKSEIEMSKNIRKVLDASEV